MSGWVQHPDLEGFALRSASRLCQDVTANVHCFTQLNAARWHLLLVTKKMFFGIKKTYYLEHDCIEIISPYRHNLDNPECSVLFITVVLYTYSEIVSFSF